MGTILFNAFVIPGAIENGKLRLSVCFELETDHDVFTNTQTDAQILEWKQAIKQFPDMARFMHEDGQLLLNGNIALTPIKKTKNPDDAKVFWAKFLGYEVVDSKNINPRSKKVDTNYKALAAGDSDIVRILPKPLKMNINGHQMVGEFTKTDEALYNSKSSAPFPESVEKILESIKLHQMILTSKILSKEIVDGIDKAYKADEKLNISRFGVLNRLSKHFEYKQITTFSKNDLAELKSDDSAKIERLIDFQRVAETVINEPLYVKEAIHKLAGILAVRRFVGTIIDFEASILPSVHLKIGLSAANTNTDLYKLIKASICFQFKTNIRTDALLQTILPAPVNDSKYGTFYTSSLAKLKSKAKIITYDTESVQRNLSQANENLRQNPQYTNLTLDALAFNKSKSAIGPTLSATQKIDIQTSQIKLRQLYKAGVKLINRIANLQTKGHQLVLIDPTWLAYDPNGTGAAGYDVHEHDILNGFVTYQRIKENGQVVSDWKSLNRIREYFGEADGTKKFETTDLAVDVDSFVDSLQTDSNGTPQLQGINNGFMFLFDGTTISSRNPLRHYEREYEDEKAQKMERVKEFTEKANTSPPENTALFLAGKRILAEDYFPFSKKTKSTYVIAREFLFRIGTTKVTPRLKFSNTRTYEYVMAMQYLNGFSPVKEQWLKQAGSALDAFISDEAKFLRHDHIKEIIVSLDKDIFHSETKKPKLQFTGETANDLVIRKGTLLNNNECVRYLLPPPVPTLQIYLWYDFENSDAFSQSRNLSSEELFQYYNKYQCELKSVQEFNKVKSGEPHCKQNCSRYCGGTSQPPVYVGAINYLPDPVVNGYMVKFYYDKECNQIADTLLYPDQFCAITQGVYPQLKAWKVRLVRTKPKETYVAVHNDAQEIEVYVPDGKQIFAEFWPTYHTQLGCFEEDLLSIGTMQRSTKNDMTFDPFHSCAVVLSFTSALQKPLFAPEVLNIHFKKYNKGIASRTSTSVTANVSLKFEHLNHWGELQVQGTQPTGELEIFGLWDDYSTNKKGPQKSMADKQEKFANGGFVYLGKVVFKNPEDPTATPPKRAFAISTNIDDIASSEVEAEVIFEFEPSFPIHYFTPSVYKVRNTSKFISYFENVNADEMDQHEKELFSHWSKRFENPAVTFNPIDYPNGVGVAIAGYLFNNVKPSAPVIEKIIPLIVRDDREQTNKVTYYERFRIYYHPAQMGKGGRLGIIINDGQTAYPNRLQGYVSHAGIDAVMDNFDDRLNLLGNWLGRANFNLDKERLEKQYITNFNPQFDDSYATGAEKIGLISYTPDYDEEQGLWYVDLELNIKNKAQLDLHSPFVQLGLVSYQPRSANYAFQNGSIADTPEAYLNDFRLSDPIKADFFSIRPTRNFKNPFVLFKHKSANKFSLSGAVSSLYFKDDANKKQLKSEFVLCVQEEGHGGFWDVIQSKLLKKQYRLNSVLDGTLMPEKELRYHPLLTELEGLALSYTDQVFEVQFGIWFQKKLFGKHRIIIYEIECHNNLDLKDLPPLLINGELQHINGVKIINNFTFSREDSV